MVRVLAAHRTAKTRPVFIPRISNALRGGLEGSDAMQVHRLKFTDSMPIAMFHSREG